MQLLLILGAVVFITGLVALLRRKNDKGIPAITAVAVLAVGLSLSLGSLYGRDLLRAPDERAAPRWWLPTRGKPGQPQPNKPRARLTESNVILVAGQALAGTQSASGDDEKRLGLIVSQNVDHLWLTLAARQADDDTVLQRQIREDVWAINQAIYSDSQFNRLDSIHILVTLEGDPVRQAAPPPVQLVDKPIIARIVTRRAKFHPKAQQAANSADALSQVAEEHWYEPFTTARRK